MNVTQTFDSGAVSAVIEATEKQAMFAAKVALNRTAEAVKVRLEREMQAVFDRPTRYTLNSVYIQYAAKGRLVVKVWIKDQQHRTRPAGDMSPRARGTGNAAVDYLAPQIYGGDRGLKKFERLLVARGWLPRGMYAVPGEGARLDQYGNMSRGQIVRVLSYLRAQFDTHQNTPVKRGDSRGSRASRATAKEQFFVGRPGGAPLGVYKRDRADVLPILMFVTHAKYRRLFRFFEVAKLEAETQWPGQFARAFEEAQRTAR